MISLLSGRLFQGKTAMKERDILTKKMSVENV